MTKSKNLKRGYGNDSVLSPETFFIVNRRPGQCMLRSVVGRGFRHRTVLKENKAISITGNFLHKTTIFDSYRSNCYLLFYLCVS